MWFYKGSFIIFAKLFHIKQLFRHIEVITRLLMRLRCVFLAIRTGIIVPRFWRLFFLPSSNCSVLNRPKRQLQVRRNCSFFSSNSSSTWPSSNSRQQQLSRSLRTCSTPSRSRISSPAWPAYLRTTVSPPGSIRHTPISYNRVPVMGRADPSRRTALPRRSSKYRWAKGEKRRKFGVFWKSLDASVRFFWEVWKVKLVFFGS